VCLAWRCGGFLSKVQHLLNTNHTSKNYKNMLFTIKKKIQTTSHSYTRKSLASAEELTKVNGKASLLAAVEYFESLQSDIFISASPGNMHNALVRRKDMLIFIYL